MERPCFRNEIPIDRKLNTVVASEFAVLGKCGAFVSYALIWDQAPPSLPLFPCYFFLLLNGIKPSFFLQLKSDLVNWDTSVISIESKEDRAWLLKGRKSTAFIYAPQNLILQRFYFVVVSIGIICPFNFALQM